MVFLWTERNRRGFKRIVFRDWNNNSNNIIRHIAWITLNIFSFSLFLFASALQHSNDKYVEWKFSLGPFWFNVIALYILWTMFSKNCKTQSALCFLEVHYGIYNLFYAFVFLNNSRFIMSFVAWRPNFVSLRLYRHL